MSEQQRTPSGVPTGGQFAATEKSEAGISLTSLDGSFLYPPEFTSAAQVVEFWAHVEIPDVVLARAERLYVERFEQMREALPAAAWKDYGSYDWEDFNPQPSDADLGATADWEGRKRAAQVDYESALAAALDARPAVLDRRDVRPLVRATAMVRTAASLDAAAYHEVCAHEVALTSGPANVRDAAMHSGMLGFSGGLLDAGRYDLDRPVESSLPATVDNGDAPAAGSRPATVEDVRRIVDEVVGAHIYNQNAALDVALDELTDSIGATSTAIVDAVAPQGRRGRA